MQKKSSLIASVLVIDDEKKLAGLISRILELEGFKVFQAHTGKEGLKFLMIEDIQVVISDVKLPDVHGVELVKSIKEKKPYVEVINFTAYGTISDGVQAIKNGGFDYLTKGDDHDKIIPLVFKAVEKAHSNMLSLSGCVQKPEHYIFSDILGKSKAIREVIEMAQKVAGTDTTVLLLGETGTGKEVFAQAIHQASARRNQSFIAVNCSSFSPELLESELFGYKEGAFTGAQKDKRGLFEEADKGTIFLDELGEMSLNLQAKLLRVLENKSFIKIGDTHTTKVNVRIVAATNRNLEQEAFEGRFRLDLYYRLSVFSLNLPPLAERKGDIELIARHYLTEFADKINKPVHDFSLDFINALNQHHWKGNVRELKNTIERVLILADGAIIGEDLLPSDFQKNGIQPGSLELEAVEKQHIVKVLKHTRGNKAEAARLLNIGLTTLYRKFEQFKLD